MQFPPDFTEGIDVSKILKSRLTTTKENNDSDDNESEVTEDNSKAEWDPDCASNIYPFVSSVTMSYLKDKNYYVNGNAKICIEWKSIVNFN